VRSPKAFLFDEPLSNLDASLRSQMRTEIAQLHRQQGITTVYVTHDQVEAMTLADRIVVLSRNGLEQFGTPDELFDTPANLFVAGFMGSHRMNLVPVDAENGALLQTAHCCNCSRARAGSRCTPPVSAPWARAPKTSAGASVTTHRCSWWSAWAPSLWCTCESPAPPSR